ncbi:hypothetical protein [Streptomyces sp.]|uniref:hypothetical protein n=1 Tax=Streptomyces sp. TaxID=1931 RepID=UPI0025E54126|nr:hypothetical protein [Streptomyces sp.]
MVYTAQMGANPTSRFHACRDHAATEEALAASDVPWTSLRNGFHASSGLDFLALGLATGEVALPVDGPVCRTAHADLAEAAAVILADEEHRFVGCVRGAVCARPAGGVGLVGPSRGGW